MCVDLKISHACGHYDREFKRCPTFHKKKASFRNRIFGCYRSMEHCGHVRRQRPRPAGNCSSCSIRVEHVADDSFRKVRLEEARDSLEKTRKKTLKPQGYQRHQVISAKTSVWPPEYYQHPECVMTPYYAEPEATRSPIASQHALAIVRQSDSKRRHKSSHKGSSKSSKAGGKRSKPQNGPPSSPAVEEPSLLRIGYVATCDDRPQLTPKTPSATHPPRSARRPSIPAPRPMYEMYLDAQKETERAYVERHVPVPPKPFIPKQQQPLRRISSQKKSNQQKYSWKGLLPALTFRPGSPVETMSEMSFACGAAREIERQTPASRR